MNRAWWGVIITVPVALVWLSTCTRTSPENPKRVENKSAGGAKTPVPDTNSKAVVSSTPSYQPIPTIPVGKAIEEVQKTLGAPSEKQGNSWDWRIEGCSLTVRTGDSRRIRSYSVTCAQPGKSLRTPDGVVLGKDTLADVREKLKDRILPEKQDFGMVDGVWFLSVYARSQSGTPEVCHYNWYLNDGIPEEAAIVASEDPPTPEIFKHVVVNQYAVDARDSAPPQASKPTEVVH